MGRTADFVPRKGEDARTAVATLYQRHCHDLCRYARQYVGSWDAAEDVVHEVFRRILVHPERVCRLDRAYLYRAVRNEAFHWVERARIRLEWQRSVRWALQAAPTPADELQAKTLATAFSMAIDALPRRCRQAFLLTSKEGITYAEAAARMGIALETVKAQIRRARRLLRRRLAAHGPEG